jgi:hypothetical protein
MTATDQVCSPTGTGSLMPAHRRHHHHRRALSVLLGAVCAVLCLTTAAQAAPEPHLTVSLTHDPATFQRGDRDADVFVTVTNSGDAPTGGPVSATLDIPAGLRLRYRASFEVNDVLPVSCTSVGSVNAGAPFTCTTQNTLAPGETQTVVKASFNVAADAPDQVTTSVTASAAGASDVTAEDQIPVIDRRPFDLTSFTARSLDSVGDDDPVAGGHPYEATTSFSFPTWRAYDQATVGGPNSPPVEQMRYIWVELPPGFVGAASAAARCPLAVIGAPLFFPPCPAASQVGSVVLTNFSGALSPSPMYNVPPEKGYPAEFAFKFSGTQVIASYPQVRSRGGGYGLNITVPKASHADIAGVSVTLWGVPSQHPGTGPFGSGPPTGGAPIPFLSNQSNCLDAQPTTKIYVDSWQHPAKLQSDGTPDLSDPNWKSRSAPAPVITGCDAPALADQFKPTISAGPTSTDAGGSTAADTPTGYHVDLAFPQSNDPTDPDTVFDPSVPQAPQLKDATVTLPAGVAVSPSAADGLGGCSDVPGDDRVNLDSISPVSCPESSKIGSVVATSPLLASHDPDTDAVTGAEPLEGDVFLIKPHPGDLDPTGDRDGRFRMLIQIDDPLLGLNAKLPGIVTADKVTGWLTARFTDNPQLPVKHLSLTFKAGDRAPLVNPTTCGAARTSGVFTPWSRGGTRSDGVVVPGTPDATSDSSFDVSWDGKGAGCPSALPFGPSMTAGTASSLAGASSPFTFDVTREDRTDVFKNVNVTLPGGLLATVKDVPLCADADANAGSCPVASRVGSATVAAGSGASPFYLRDQPVSLTGPYKGAPYGLAIAVHAVAGPFDLGTVVVRQALNIDPDDAHVTVVSDPLPTMRDGVPLRVRRINVVVDRPGFMRSPTSCAAKAIGASIGSLNGTTVNLNSSFAVDGCSKLPFAPKLAMRLTGSKETKVGGHPGIEATVTQRPGEAAIKSAEVTLPLSLALDPDHAASENLCEYTDGLADRCPEKSVIGTATAVSPLLKAPLTGKVFFVKGVRFDPKSGRQIRTLPTLLLELRGEVSLNLRATSSVPDNKHLVSTFSMIPDAPISSFALKLDSGKNGILVVTDGANVCAETEKPFLSAVAQNGKRVDRAMSLTPDCPLAVASKTFTAKSARVKVTGIGAGTVTISGAGLKTTKRTITAATSATVTAPLTAKGRQLRRAKRDIRIKVSYRPKGAKKAKVAYSTAARTAKKARAKARA